MEEELILQGQAGHFVKESSQTFYSGGAGEGAYAYGLFPEGEWKPGKALPGPFSEQRDEAAGKDVASLGNEGQGLKSDTEGIFGQEITKILPGRWERYDKVG
jgi:hypothetical protein